MVREESPIKEQFDLVDLISLMAFCYPAVAKIPNSFVVTGTPYILPYRVRAETIEILRVLHGAQQWPENYVYLDR